MPESAFLSLAPPAATPLQAAVSAASPPATDATAAETSSFNDFLQGASQYQQPEETVPKEAETNSKAADTLQPADSSNDESQSERNISGLIKKSAEDGSQQAVKAEEIIESGESGNILPAEGEGLQEKQSNTQNKELQFPFSSQQKQPTPLTAENDILQPAITTQQHTILQDKENILQGEKNVLQDEESTAPDVSFGGEKSRLQDSHGQQTEKIVSSLLVTETTETFALQQNWQPTGAEQREPGSKQKNNNAAPLPLVQQISLTKDLPKISLSITQPQGAQKTEISNGNWQRDDAIVARLQSIIDAADEMGTVSINITKETAIAQESIQLKTLGQLQSSAAYIAINESSRLSETTSANTKLFRILNPEEQDNSIQQRSFVWQQTENPGAEKNSSVRFTAAGTLSDIAVKPYPSPQAEINTQGEQSPVTEKNISMAEKALNTEKVISRDSFTLASIKTETKTTINNGNQERQIRFDHNSSLINRALPMENNTKGALFSSDSGSNGTLFSHAGQPQAVETTVDSVQTITLPSGVTVRENEVVRQFIDRFQINGRNLESRINIKLNPAELGEIEITLTVKEKAIKANVVAQSQITQGILEKNLDKIRAILEKQGFAIGELNIMAKDHTAAEFDLFGREFGQQQQDIFPRKNQSTALSSQQEEPGQDAEKEEGRVNLAV